MPMTVPAVSVVIPTYNEAGTLRELYTRIRAEFALLELRGEIIFIDDGSTDDSRQILRELAAQDADCRVIMFRRNCGKSAALAVGFRAAEGEFVLTMDADLQDDPAEIPRLLEALLNTDLVSGWKARRHDPIGKTFPSRIFNAVVRNITGIPLHDMNCGLKGYRRQVVKEIVVYGEMHRFLPVLAAERGFRISELPVTHHPRRSGKSKFGIERYLRGFLDLITVVYITRFRTRPLHFFGSAGLGLLGFSLVWAGVLSTFASVYDKLPWRSFFWMVAFGLFVLGLLSFPIGLIAEGLLAATSQQIPTPPITERINFATADEVSHAG
ncbi:MAG: glycosyltransferase family 2 protein [Armatimonadota bacterium]